MEFSGIIDYRKFFLEAFSLPRWEWIHLESIRQEGKKTKKKTKKSFWPAPLKRAFLSYESPFSRKNENWSCWNWSFHVCSVNHDKRWMAEIVFNTSYGCRVTSLSLRNVLLHLMLLSSYYHKKKSLKIEEPFRGLDRNKSAFPKALMKFFDFHPK